MHIMKTKTHPRTRVAHVQVVPATLWRELGARVTRNEVAERADLSAELARSVFGVHPVGDLGNLKPPEFKHITWDKI